jgi:AcrR family transcriptional regulator
MQPAQSVPPVPPVQPARLARADRRKDLLDAALDLVASGDVESVSVDTVADRAAVSRSLVYKHFANRTEILTALYERESTRLHNQLAADVTAARTLEEKYRALCHGSLAAAKARGQIFDGLRSAAGMNKAIRKVQRDRDRETAAAYVRMAQREIGAPPEVAEPVTALLLGAIAPMLNLWHARPTEAYAAELEAAFMCLVVGTIGELRQRVTHDSRPDALSRWMSERVDDASPDQLRRMLRTLVQEMTDAGAYADVRPDAPPRGS